MEGLRAVYLRDPPIDKPCRRLVDSHPPPITSQLDLDERATLLTRLVTQALDKTLPLTSARPSTKRWWDAAVLDPLKATAQQLRRLAQRHRTTQARQASHEAATTYREAISKAKRDHWHNFLANLNPSTLYLASKYTTRDPSVPLLPIPPLRRPDGVLTSQPTEQAELLFQGTSAPTIPCDLRDVDSTPTPTTPSTPFTLEEVTHTIDNLSPDKALGADGITNRVITAGGKPLAQQLATIANACLRLGLFPTEWKRARTIILKKPDKPDYTSPAAYRPIALLSCLSKVIEAVMARPIEGPGGSQRYHPRRPLRWSPPTLH